MSQYVFDLTDKVAVVTGSARGLGKAIAKGLANWAESSFFWLLRLHPMLQAVF